MTIDWRTQERTFVVRTQPAREVLASVAITSKGFPVFLPMRTIERNHARKREMVPRPLFPRYLFVEFTEAEKRYGEINRARGVVELLRDADAIPVPVPETVIDNLRHRERLLKAKAGEVTTGWQAGDMFKLRRGPWAELEASYVGEDHGQVSVIARMFGRDMLLTVPFAEIPPCPREIDNSAA